MNLKLSEEALLFTEVADRFLQDGKAATTSGMLEPNALDVWSSMVEMGWLALPLPEEMGGLAASPELLAVVAEALGRACACQPYLANIEAMLVLLAIKDVVATSLAQAMAEGSKRATFVRSPSLRAVAEGSGYRLEGEARLVLGGSSADTFIVLVDLAGAPILCLIDGMADGLDRRPVETIDGSDMADIGFNNVPLENSLQAPESIEEAVDRIESLTLLLFCAEAVGAMEGLVQATTEYVAMRHQFGKPLRSFQVIDHAIAEMQVALEEARSVVRIGLERLEDTPAQRHRSVSAARVKAVGAGRRISHHAIQFHGAIGVTEELNVGAYAKRLLAIGCCLETEASALDRYVKLLSDEQCWSYLGEGQGGRGSSLCSDMQSGTFQEEVSSWLDANLSPEIARAQRLTTMVYVEAEVAMDWQRLLDKRGWAAPNWPEEFGGTGWSPEQRYIWAHENAKRFAPITSPLGLPLVGPVLFHFGTPEQQARFLPPIISGEELWCQGFSEPDAGSDLAALNTRAVRDGNHYIVNGTKIWTTQGHDAHMMAALVRTGTDGSKRDGISFLLIDMRSQGIDVRPIRTIGGNQELNQIFFDDVRVPAVNLVADEGQGWEIAKFLLEYERGGDIMSAAQRALLRDIHEAAVRRGHDGEDYRRTVARIAIDIDTLEAMELLVLFGAASHPATPSILKLRASEIQQAVTELGVSVMGSDAVRWVSKRPLYDDPTVMPEDGFVSRYLNSRANTIFGGAREIQKTLIARSVQ